MTDARRVLTPWKVGLAYALIGAVFAAILWAAPAVRTYQLWDGTNIQTAWGVAALAVIAAVWAWIGFRRGGGRAQRTGAGAALLLAAFSLGVAVYLIWQETPLLEGPQQLVETEAEQIGQADSRNDADNQ